MGTEIERKFLVVGEGWRAGEGTRYRQGYLPTTGEVTVRVRLSGEHGFLTIKGPTVGLQRAEFEYEVPIEEARELLDTLCTRPQIEKTRYELEHAGRLWQVDEFHAENQGLVMAEVEIENEDEEVELPPWVGTEVSDDPRYTNARLARHPFSRW